MKGPELHRGIRAAIQCLHRPTSSTHSVLAPRLRRHLTPKTFRCLTTDNHQGSESQPDFKAAPEIDLSPESQRKEDHEQASKDALLNRIRIVPASPSYFTAKPSFTDDLLSLQALLRKYQTLPVMPPGQAPRVAWLTLEEYKSMVGSEPVKSARYTRLVELLQRLNYINVELVPQEVHKALDRYKRAIQPNLNVAKKHFPDQVGRALGIGRRKTSVARAYLIEGEGEILINGKSLTQFFGRVHDRESAIWALKATERVSKYNVFALVEGGGTTGQAEAITLAVAKALMVHEPLLKPALRRAGCVTRDPRKVERKKPGKLKARKMPAWVKR
ncbi:hypothetical protein EJ08DRAFT_669954 [Tothia fuscella]|uniref:Small ribosomal subunit protein uS9m n=1 Tax=Tothia fuscella TaxID=1048955 RepID=A0A9P4NUI9_9PEZI|nr:hypothetical protein EJ08DRAFT_669954 [Tothia fuscella]